MRAGETHRFTNVWVAVVGDRVFVRSWNDLGSGWFRAFLAEPEGSARLAGEEIPVRGRRVRGTRILAAVTRAYAEKYPTSASRKWVEGFAEPEREANTLELRPRSKPRPR